ncbi:DUF2279 domain-containing protein [Ramlibacter sp. USB13]|uniref:DUF2279 domain-containing protein n=1 Tax=Ramlibacter cellulosilyticus TaxID=2764187 RepID=A0A923MNC1_9BURK|nr:DUF2279 domain-containing protein [Ramlibacter cellulosilyticus]MBC5782510.1 DUF2279 domain-containing protein [Ramlibacter cellulosilyticus]
MARVATAAVRFLLAALLCAAVAAARAGDETPPEPPPDLTLRNTAIIGATSALMATYGYRKWWNDGFGEGFTRVDEGWFGQDTAYGGTDKLGHMFANHAGVRLLRPLFEGAGNSRESSIRLAGWTTLGIFTAIEVLDGYSRKWDFSAQDALMNVAGVALGVVLESRPDLDDKFDFRLAYKRSPDAGFSPASDYSGQRYLFMVKADGFEATRHVPVLRYLEFGVGYQARGFETGGERRRDLYFAVSVNLARVLADAAYGGRMHSTRTQRGAELLFELVQFPTAVYSRHPVD